MVLLFIQEILSPCLIQNSITLSVLGSKLAAWTLSTSEGYRKCALLQTAFLPCGQSGVIQVMLVNDTETGSDLEIRENLKKNCILFS